MFNKYAKMSAIVTPSILWSQLAVIPSPASSPLSKQGGAAADSVDSQHLEDFRPRPRTTPQRVRRLALDPSNSSRRRRIGRPRCVRKSWVRSEEGVSVIVVCKVPCEHIAWVLWGYSTFHCWRTPFRLVSARHPIHVHDYRVPCKVCTIPVESHVMGTKSNEAACSKQVLRHTRTAGARL